MQGNFGFASTLLDTLKKYQNACPVMLSSSIQATLVGRYAEGEYGKSKKAGEELFFETCTSCDGLGEKACKPCNTVGLKKYCRRCKGTGLGVEKAKRGEPEKTVRCRTCNGMGRQ
jgi:hypothetical protein